MVKPSSHSQLVRTKAELDLMRKSGNISARALKKVLENVKPGVSLAILDKIGEEEILKLGGKPAFKTVPGYHWTTCLSVNDEVVHGIPGERVLHDGDIISVDIGAIYQGWYTDTAWTVIVGSGDTDKKRFLAVGEEAMWSGIKKAIVGNRIGDISGAMQSTVEKGGYSIVRSLSGHGVGRSYHENPEVPGFGKPGTGKEVLTGMTLAIEAIYTSGSGEVVQKEDGWTIVSEDYSLGGMFEMTVITGDRPEVITDWRKV